MIALKIGKWLELELGWGHLWLKLGSREVHYCSEFGWTVSWAEPGWAE